MSRNRAAQSGVRINRATASKRSAKSVVAARSLSYASILRKKSEEPNKRKGERTRDRLVAAAAELLESKGYRDLRVSDVNERAGVSNALFYLYFTNKESVSREVLSGFLQWLYTVEDERPRAESAEESIYQANLEYIQRFAANAGLMRCLLQFGDEVPEFGRLWRDANSLWLHRVVGRLSREVEIGKQGINLVWATTAALGTMVDGLLRILYVEHEAATKMYIRALGDTDAGLALFVTRLWVRALYAREMKWAPSSRPE